MNDLAHNLIILLNKNILDDVILSVKADSDVITPKEWNYTTDKIFLSFDIDIKKLKAFIEKNVIDYDKNKLTSCSGFMWLGDDN